jgi:hypothetical protein
LLPLRSRLGFAVEDGFGVGPVDCGEVGEALGDEPTSAAGPCAARSRGVGALAQPEPTHAMTVSAARRLQDERVDMAASLVAISANTGGIGSMPAF